MANLVIRLANVEQPIAVAFKDVEAAEEQLRGIRLGMEGPHSSATIRINDDMGGSHVFLMEQIVAAQVETGVFPDWLIKQQALMLIQQQKIQMEAQRIMQAQTIVPASTNNVFKL